VSTLTFQPKNASEATTPVREPARPQSERSYHELPGLRHETRDVLKQLDANISLLEDLGGRLSYVLGEVRSVIRR
jgi:hypothetical protein